MSGISTITEDDFDACLFTGASFPMSPVLETTTQGVARRRLTFDDHSPTDSPPSTPSTEREIKDISVSVGVEIKAGEKAARVFQGSPQKGDRREVPVMPTTPKIDPPKSTPQGKGGSKRRLSFDHPPTDSLLSTTEKEIKDITDIAEIEIKSREKATHAFHELPQKGMFREIHVVPPTPQRPQKKFKAETGNGTKSNQYFSVVESFGTALEFATVDPKSDPIQYLQSRVSLPLTGGLYYLPSGQIVAAIKQPIQEKPTCGPGCALMIGLTNMEQMIASDDFWYWYGGARISSGKSLLTAFKHLSIPARVCKLTNKSADISFELDNPSIEYQMMEPKDAVAYVKKTIEETGKPVILAITHPILEGHWIIVDGFQNGNAYIRDPYTGMAFALPEATLSKWLLENEDLIQDMVYFPADAMHL